MGSGSQTSIRRLLAAIIAVAGLGLFAVGVGATTAGADPGNGKGQGPVNAQGNHEDKGNPCVTKGNDTAEPPEGCDESRPGGVSQGKVCPENHPKGKRVPAVDKGLSPDRATGKARGGTEVVCESTTVDTVPPTTTTTGGTTTTIEGGETPRGGTVITPALEDEVLGEVVTPEAERARAVPSELAFTGPTASAPALLGVGFALMLLGAVLLRVWGSAGAGLGRET